MVNGFQTQAFDNSGVAELWDYRILRNSICDLHASHLATGPLRQATSPPRSGAWVGVGRLRGAGDSLGNKKVL